MRENDKPKLDANKALEEIVALFTNNEIEQAEKKTIEGCQNQDFAKMALFNLPFSDKRVSDPIRKAVFMAAMDEDKKKFLREYEEIIHKWDFIKDLNLREGLMKAVAVQNKECDDPRYGLQLEYYVNEMGSFQVFGSPNHYPNYSKEEVLDNLILSLSYLPNDIRNNYLKEDGYTSHSGSTVKFEPEIRHKLVSMLDEIDKYRAFNNLNNIDQYCAFSEFAFIADFIKLKNQNVDQMFEYIDENLSRDLTILTISYDCGLNERIVKKIIEFIEFSEGPKSTVEDVLLNTRSGPISGCTIL